ncbi:single-stranded DNA-binding protein [Streptomonospora wellingtoniae]|uniref:Single-stranded DNA-binding protein n=1 Tax=Streptomonospora wellingtoniae TaxID=3075544 RepID=A0ABU2KV09_9ACTN|nr:single-stranded DNA-binding protein [Streptomonospora sp. DSM 45055]MDT0303140.1 single-stranded DNA-binding protein [Streptomonospora sp. DSM 45055]
MPDTTGTTATAPAPATVPTEPAAPDRAGARRPAKAALDRESGREAGHRNEVVVAGRITAEPYVRELASGDRLTTWRVSIARAPAQQRPSQSADPITCVSFQQAIEERTREWRLGDVVQVSGALRRRFWRSPKGSASVVEIEARAVQRVSRCPDPAASAEAARG